MAFVEETIGSFILLFLVMDPLASLPIFLSMSSKMNRAQTLQAANKAVAVAGALLFIFLLTGPLILDFMRISFSSFQIAGGIVLLILGIELVLAISLGKPTHKDVSMEAILIGTPLITGPGVLTTSIILVQDHGLLSTIIAGLAALTVSWLVLRHAQLIKNLLGYSTIEAASRVIGLLLVATAVQLIKTGLVSPWG